MKKFNKLIAATVVATLMGTMMIGCGTKNSNNETKTSETSTTESNTADVSYVIGIGQFAEHGSLDNCREGFIEGLKQSGIEEGVNLTLKTDNANADTSTAALIAKNYVGDGVDLICGIATPMAQSAYGAALDSNIPVVFTAVTDPVLSEFASEDKMPLGNITGTSDKLPVESQLEMIRAILPDAKKIGIMYTTSEVNSVSAIEEYKELAPNYGFEIVEGAISTSADIPMAADNLLSKVDCISNLTDNTVVSALPVILAKANEKMIPVFGSEVEQVKIGCLAAVGLDYYQLGIITGQMAAKILKGEVEASKLPFEVIEEGSFYGNTAVASNLGIGLPTDYVTKAAMMFDTIEEIE